MVVRTAALDKKVCQRALGELYQLYSYPVYCCIRRRGRDHQDAEDLTQDFFASLMERDHFATADPQKGKLRAFIQADLRLFLNNAYRKETALKRGGGAEVFSMDAVQAEQDYEAAGGRDLDPIALLDREWAKATFAAALQLLKLSYNHPDRAGVFEVLSPLLDKPSGPGMYEEAAERLGMKESTIKVAMVRLRERLGAALRQVVADTLEEPTPAAVQDEIRYLFSVM